MKLAGEFEFLGDAYPGDPEYDAPPKKGVVKLFYLPNGPSADRTSGESAGRCGLFRCPWWRWGAFKEAATRLQPDRKATGIYPVATIVAVPIQREAGGADRAASSEG
jgi:hypothetical protein